MLNVRITAGHRLAQAIGLPRRRRKRSQLAGEAVLFLSEITEIFCKIKSKLLNSRVLAGGSVVGCAKKVLVLSIYKKVVEKSAV